MFYYMPIMLANFFRECFEKLPTPKKVMSVK